MLKNKVLRDKTANYHFFKNKMETVHKLCSALFNSVCLLVNLFCTFVVSSFPTYKFYVYTISSTCHLQYSQAYSSKCAGITRDE